MHFKNLGLFVLLIINLSCQENQDVAFSPALIIPQPSDITLSEGQFLLTNNTEVVYEETFKVSGEFLKFYLSENLKTSNEDSNQILFIKDTSFKNAEAYELLVSEHKISIKASTDQGAFYAVQSLRQLLPSEFESKEKAFQKAGIQTLHIKDTPNFKYRGMHLDVGRHFFSVDFIKKYIDALAMLKMNTFHWHLTEDQGWRIEIKKYPKLQDISAYRNETLVGHYSDQPHQFDGKRYGGYYTQEAVKDIVAYAQERFVTIIPEIEMPGHSQAALAAYPELGCTGKDVKVATKWGVFEEIYCTKEATFDFLEDVLDEVLELFPSEYIHIGGDEAPKTRWKQCSDCQDRIQSEGLKDEHELQNYFITRIEKYLNNKGRQIIGWDEILEGGLAPNATVMSWRGTNGAIQAAKAGHNVVMTPTSHCYFDYYQSDNENEPLAIGGYLPLDKVYNFNPIPEELSEEEAQFVMGAQGNVWTEYMPEEDKVEYMVFPRILAMSEVVWTQSHTKNYKDFINRLEHIHKRLDALDINYANHLYEVEAKVVSVEGNPFFELQMLTEGKTIRYTLDGSEPTLNSAIYSEHIPIQNSVQLKAALFNSEKQIGRTVNLEFNYHKAVGANITIDKVPHKAYSGSGAEGLINGVSGSDTRYGDAEWLGFWGEDIEITIDLGEEKEINSIETRFHNGNGQWIYAPKEFKFGFQNHRLNSEGKIPISDKNIIPLKIEADVTSSYIYFKFPNYGTIPEGKQGAGNKAWTFIDEIIVN